MADFDKVGFLTLRDGKILMCRKGYFTSRLILPGGRIEPGESAMDCLHRELVEELGEVAPLNATWVGRYRDVAHSDDPSVVKTLEIQLYSGDIQGKPRPCSEIVELVWFGENDDRNELTPIFVNQILPDLVRRRILHW